MIQKTRVFLRGDGNSRIGLGHIHRLLTLCEILKIDFDCHFVIRSPLEGIRKLIINSCGQVVELDGLTDHLTEVSQYEPSNEIVVVDGYDFDTDYQRSIKQKGNMLVCIDDLHRNHFVADAIINPAGGLSESLYSKESITKVFSGPEFALLKKPFLDAAMSGVRQRAGSNSIFICMGGADPNNHTLLVLRQCLSSSFDSYKVVVGEAYLHKHELEAEVRSLNQKIHILSNLDPQGLANVMKECSVAVCSASGIAYEYSSVGGELYVIQTATNQKDLFDYLVESKLAFKFEDFRVPMNAASQSFQRQREVFDGKSDKRILRIFNRLDLNLHGKMRRANVSDLMTTFHWANNLELRAQSFNSEPISLENHSAWFQRKINDPATVLYIFEYKHVPIGQVRFDITEAATVSYSIDHQFRGRGWGQILLQRAIEGFLQERGRSMKIVGYVKRANRSSSAIFENLGFIRTEAREYPDSYKYELSRNERNTGS